MVLVFLHQNKYDCNINSHDQFKFELSFFSRLLEQTADFRAQDVRKGKLMLDFMENQFISYCALKALHCCYFDTMSPVIFEIQGILHLFWPFFLYFSPSINHFINQSVIYFVCNFHSTQSMSAQTFAHFWFIHNDLLCLSLLLFAILLFSIL